ncbi:beta-propeller fold lactonase family protein [bacterium]|nr:beta-propeller fold lactonase family protein [bacterium]
MSRDFLLAMLGLAMTCGCGGAGSLQVNVPGSNGSTGGGNSGGATTTLREFIVIPNGADNTITVKQVNLADGTSTPRATLNSGAQQPFVVKCNPVINSFYVLHAKTDLLTEFRLDANGNVTAIGNIATPAGAALMSIHPSGRLVFVAGSTARQIFTYSVASDGTLTKLTQTSANFLSGNPGLDGDFSGNGAFFHVPVMGGVQTLAVQNDGSLISASLNNFGAAISNADQVWDVDVHPGQASLQAAVQRAGNDAIASYGLNNGTLINTSLNTVNYEVGTGDFSALGGYYLGEATQPIVHGFAATASTGALTELSSSPFTAAGVNALLTQVDYTSSFVFSTQSTASNLLVTRSLNSNNGQFVGSSFDSQNLAGPNLFDFFLFRI